MDSTIKTGRTTAIIAYLTLVGCLIAITMNLEPKNGFARFHIRQALGIHLLYHVFAIGLSYTGFAWLPVPLLLIYVVIWGFGFLDALKGQEKMLPLIGPYFQKWFSFVQ